MSEYFYQFKMTVYEYYKNAYLINDNEYKNQYSSSFYRTHIL